MRISLKSGENSHLTSFDPISTLYIGQNEVKYCMDPKSDPVPFLYMQKYTSGANFVEIGENSDLLIHITSHNEPNQGGKGT